MNWMNGNEWVRLGFSMLAWLLIPSLAMLGLATGLAHPSILCPALTFGLDDVTRGGTLEWQEERMTADVDSVLSFEISPLPRVMAWQQRNKSLTLPPLLFQ